MANFQTHLYGGVLASGGAVLALHGAGLVTEGQTLMLFGLGVVGSLLPDIDADASAPVRAFFGVLGAVLAFAWTLPLVGRYGPWQLALLWMGLFAAVRVLLCEAFARLTVHRGIWHSLLAALFAALAAVNLLHWVLGQAAQVAWTGGLMVGVGYLTHLVLDEAFGVDLLGVRTKRSFGTALKPWSLRNPGSSLAMAAALAVMVVLAPLNQPHWSGPGPDLAARLADSLGRLEAWSDRSLGLIRAWLQ
ncbi:MAG: metal-dependent hydrolase [Bdellovibrio bacteriovorus]